MDSALSMCEYLTQAELIAAFPRIFTTSLLKKSRMKSPPCDGPPYRRMGRRILYLRSEVEGWLAALPMGHAPALPRHLPPDPLAPATRKRGRPTKAEQMMRRATRGARP